MDTPAGYGHNAARTVAELTRRRRNARAAGHAISLEWGEPGINAVAVAIPPGAETPALGTLSVAGPASRFTLERMQATLPILQERASQLASVWPLRPRGQHAATIHAVLAADTATPRPVRRKVPQ
jgi:IclR family transcriptional regulator, acetate operon repressor